MSTEPKALGTLRREHEFIEKLLSRLGELGERIGAGEPVSPRTIRYGVGLLDAYLHRVHARQFDVELWPTASMLAGPECRVPLDRVRSDHDAVRRAAQELLGLATRWAAGDARAQNEVAERLVALAAADAAMNAFEEQHPFVCLATSLPPRASVRLAETFDGHAGTKAVLEANIDRFVSAVETSR